MNKRATTTQVERNVDMTMTKTIVKVLMHQSLVVMLGVVVSVQAGIVSAQERVPTKSTNKAAHKPASLTNSDVIELVKAGFSDDLILIRIHQATEKRFDLSNKGMLDLKAAGVSERLIAVMFGGPDHGASVPTGPSSKSAEGPPASAPHTPTTSTNTPHGVARLDSGIYVKTGDAWQPLEPTVFSGGKSGGLFTSGLTMGIKKAKWKAVVRSPQAAQRINTSTPEFRFYFETKGSGLSGAVTMLGASSPNEFVLARMSQDDDERSLVVGEFGAFGASSGTRSKDSVSLTIERLEPGVYRVAPKEPLATGEYCFFYAAGASSFAASGTGKLFDFGLDLDSRSSH